MENFNKCSAGQKKKLSREIVTFLSTSALEEFTLSCQGKHFEILSRGQSYFQYAKTYGKILICKVSNVTHPTAKFCRTLKIIF